MFSIGEQQIVRQIILSLSLVMDSCERSLIFVSGIPDVFFVHKNRQCFQVNCKF